VGAAGVSRLADALQKISGFIALQGLFTLYKASHNALHEWNTTMKFVAIKLVIVLDMIQDVLAGFLVTHGIVGVGSQCHLRDENLAKIWDQCMLVVEAVFMALLMYRAFPAQELLGAAIHVRALDATDLADQGK